MTANPFVRNSQGFNEVAPVLSNAAVSILALGQNARGLHKLLNEAPQAKFESYPGQTGDLPDTLKHIATAASQIVDSFAVVINKWGTAGLAPNPVPNSQAFSLLAAEPISGPGLSGSPPIASVLGVFHQAKILNQLTDKVNKQCVAVSPAQDLSKLKTNVDAATLNTRAAEEAVAVVKAAGDAGDLTRLRQAAREHLSNGTLSQRDWEKVPDEQIQVAATQAAAGRLDAVSTAQIVAFVEFMQAAKLAAGSEPIGNFFSLSDISGWVQTATSALGTGVSIANKVFPLLGIL